jgi:CheY-like chemotaxis protein
VREAQNGEDAIQVWESWEPHLIWMDMRMSGMNGYEATRHIKSQPKGNSTVIIALTAGVFEEQQREVFDAGCDDLVRKPFSKDNVLEKMAEHLGVEYLYEGSRPSAPPPAESSTPRNPSSVTADQLNVMPAEWVSQFHYAAAQGSDRLIMQLIEQIPPEHQSLSKGLTHLVRDFRFDQLMALTQTR